MPDLKPMETQEIYCGYDRGRLSNGEGYKYNQVFTYSQPSDIEKGAVALEGRFLLKKDYIEARQIGAKLFLNFNASEVNLFMVPPEGSATLEVFLDDKLLPNGIKGADVSEKGEIRLTEARMYNLINATKPVQGILSISLKRRRFRAYVFTFNKVLSAYPLSL